MTEKKIDFFMAILRIPKNKKMQAKLAFFFYIYNNYYNVG